MLPTDQMTTDVRENRRIIQENAIIRERYVTAVRTLGIVLGLGSGYMLAATPPIQEMARGILVNNPELVSQLVHTFRGVDGHTLVSYAENTAKFIGAGGLGIVFGGLGHMFADGWHKLVGQGDVRRARDLTSPEAVQNRQNAEMIRTQRMADKIRAQQSRNDNSKRG